MAGIGPKTIIAMGVAPYITDPDTIEGTYTVVPRLWVSGRAQLDMFRSTAWGGLEYAKISDEVGAPVSGSLAAICVVDGDSICNALDDLVLDGVPDSTTVYTSKRNWGYLDHSGVVYRVVPQSLLSYIEEQFIVYP